jgi:hypothetical protein
MNTHQAIDEIERQIVTLHDSVRALRATLAPTPAVNEPRKPPCRYWRKPYVSYNADGSIFRTVAGCWAGGNGLH